MDQVAKLAEFQIWLLAEPENLSQSSQNQSRGEVSLSDIAVTNDTSSNESQLNLDSFKNEEIIEQIKSVNIDTISPLEALNFLYSIKRQLI